MRFLRPVPAGEQVTATITVAGKHPEAGTLDLECRGADPEGNEVIAGTAVVQAPTEKIRQAVPELPDVELRRKNRYLELIAIHTRAVLEGSFAPA